MPASFDWWFFWNFPEVEWDLMEYYTVLYSINIFQSIFHSKSHRSGDLSNRIMSNLQKLDWQKLVLKNPANLKHWDCELRVWKCCWQTFLWVINLRTNTPPPAFIYKCLIGSSIFSVSELTEKWQSGRCKLSASQAWQLGDFDFRLGMVDFATSNPTFFHRLGECGPNPIIVLWILRIAWNTRCSARETLNRRLLMWNAIFPAVFWRVLPALGHRIAFVICWKRFLYELSSAYTKHR